MKVDDKHVAVARIYSRAMYALATEQGAAEDLLDELGALAGYVEEDADFAAFLASPVIDAEQRAESLEKVLRGRASDLLVDSLQVISSKGRLGLLSTIAETYRQRHLETLGRVDVHVTTATGLSERLREKLKAMVRERRDKEPELIETVDPSLIGGIVVQIGDKKADASVARQIDKLHKALRERAASEILKSRQERATG